MNIHPCFKTKKIFQYIADLLIEYNYDSYSDLSESDKSGLLILLIEAAGRGSEAECITESTHFDQLIYYLKQTLLNDTSENREKLAEVIKDNAIEYYDHTMKNLFEYVYGDYKQERKEWLENIGKFCTEDYEVHRENALW